MIAYPNATKDNDRLQAISTGRTPRTRINTRRRRSLAKVAELVRLFTGELEERLVVAGDPLLNSEKGSM